MARPWTDPATPTLAGTRVEGWMSIGELAERSGVSVRTIRYWEAQGAIPTAPRTQGGTRRYPHHFRFYVEGCIALKEIGFALDDIRLIAHLSLGLTEHLTTRERAQAVAAIRAHVDQLERKMRVLGRLRELLGASEQRAVDAARAGLLAEIEPSVRGIRSSQRHHGHDEH